MNKIFIKIPHYSKNIDRKNLIETQISKINNDCSSYNNYSFSFEIIKDYDKEDITLEIINKFILFYDNLKKTGKVSINTLFKSQIYVAELNNIFSGFVSNSNYRRLSGGEISLIVKTVNIWKSIIDNNIDICLIVEDDSVFPDNFTEKYLNILNNLPKDWDILYVNLIHIDGTENKRTYLPKLRWNKRKEKWKIDHDRVHVLN